MPPEIIRQEIEMIVLMAFRASGAIVEARERLNKPTCSEASIEFLSGRIEDKKVAILQLAERMEEISNVVRQQ